MQLAGDYGRSGSRNAPPPGKPAPPPTSLTPKPRTSVTPGRGGSYSRAPGPPPAVAPGPVNTDPNAWLGGDSGYQDQLRQLQLALSNFNADVTRRQGMIGTDFSTSQDAMQDQKVIDLDRLEADWAGRGLLRSGLYGDAVGDYNTEFDKRLANLVSGRDRALAQILQEQNAFTTQQSLDQQAAREAALRRRSANLGVV